MMASIFELLGVELKAPDHSTVSRRAMVMKSVSKRCVLPADPAHILIDSTGLKVFGAGEWLQEKHGRKSCRSWRKLHLAMDANTGLIVASVLTEQDVDDPSQVGPLIDQIAHEIGQVTADGAYDGEPTYDTIAKRDSQIKVAIPPRATAQPCAQCETDPTTRDTHLLMIQSLGRLGWQEAVGYGTRALVETTMGRYKAIIGPWLRARDWRGQCAEAAVAVAVLNRMLTAGRPNSVRTSVVVA
ncbi:MAG: IS5 family transposase [Burkholderiaceae bacterium]|nr:IS5 family transposase [Burkholderiaceae bacterium]